MTFELVQESGDRVLRLAGQPAASDAPELRKALNSIPREPRRIVVDLQAGEGLSLAVIQVLLVFIRHARSIPCPVEIRHPRQLAPSMALWGLDHAGWEAFFHGR